MAHYPLFFNPALGAFQSVRLAELPSDLIGTAKAAVLCDCEASTLAKHREHQTGPPYYKLGYHTVKYSEAQILAYKAKREGAAA